MKETPASRALLPDTQIPYEGAAPMRVVDRESAADVAELVIAMVPELPTPKTRKR